MLLSPRANKGVFMLQRLTKGFLALAIAGSLLAGPLASPASASTGSTYTLIESGLALIGGIILYNNYQHKRQAANRIVGYTRNGGTVYGDGRIVMPDGSTIYPGRNGQYPWGQYAYYNPNAGGYTYDYGRTGRYDRTRRHGDDDDDYNRGNYNNNYYRGGYAPGNSAWGHSRGRHHGDRDDRHHRGDDDHGGHHDRR